MEDGRWAWAQRTPSGSQGEKRLPLDEVAVEFAGRAEMALGLRAIGRNWGADYGGEQSGGAGCSLRFAVRIGALGVWPGAGALAG